MFHAILAVISIIALAVSRKWRDWREYYPTILYAIIGDLTYNFFFYRYSLWEYKGILPHTVFNLIIDFLAFPCVVILYLSYFPKKTLNQAIYIISFSLGYSLIEFVAHYLNYFIYFNGWKIYWSFTLYIIGFVLIKLHMKHPFITWTISIICASVITVIFGFPFDMLK